MLFLRSLVLTLILAVLCAIVYPLLLFGIAQLAPNKGLGKIVVQNNKTYYLQIGQHFKDQKYFQSRPSASNYNPTNSGGSNLAPSSLLLKTQISMRLDSFKKYNPTIASQDIPVDLLTASASGLDPHISPDAARVQVPRVAKLNHLNEQQLYKMIDSLTEPPFLNSFGPSKINVLLLNLALESQSLP